MSDPLSLIRKATISSNLITHEKGYYIFNENLKLPDNTSTCFRRTLKGNDYCYTIKDIIFFLENSDMTVAEYRRKAVESRIFAVVEQDRQALKNYLTGVIDTCPQIDLQLAASFVLPSIALTTNISNVIDNNQKNLFEQPIISNEKMLEQREKHAARLEMNIQKSKDVIFDNNNSNNNMQKRTISQAFNTNEEEVLDKEFIEADRHILTKLRSDEIPAHTISTILNTIGTDFSNVLKLFNDKILKPKQTSSSTTNIPYPPPPPPKHPLTTTATTLVGGLNHHSKQSHKDTIITSTSSIVNKHNNILPNKDINIPMTVKRMHSYPIIVVPSAVSSIVTLMNVKELLIDGLYQPMEDIKHGFSKRGKEIMVERDFHMNKTNNNNNNNNNNIALKQIYRIIDDPSKLNDNEWESIVAVFASGQLWQFKGWKYNTPVSLFNQVLGVHVAVDDRIVDPLILSWNCKLLKINLFKQHLNAGTATEFWMHLDDFLRLKKPHLYQQNIVRNN